MKKIISTLYIVLLCVEAFASGHTVTTSSTNATCNGACNGTATATVSGGVGPFVYSWVPNGGTAAIATNLCAGTYTVTVTDVSDMSTATASITITEPGQLTLMPGSSTTICGGGSAQIYAAGYGGTPPYYTYTYVPALNGPGPPYTVTPTVTTSYTIYVTDANNCMSAPSTITIYVSPAPHADFTMVPDSTNGLNYFAFNTTTGNGLIYNWDFGDSTTSNLASPTHLYSISGTYTVSLVATTPNGCLESVSHTITVNATPASCLSLFNIAFDTTSTDPYAYTVYNLSYGSALSYLWSFGDGTSSTLQNPTHVYGGGGPYQLCLTVDNGSGCTQTYCDSLMYVDSLSRTTNQLSITVVDVASPLVTNIHEQSINSSVEVYPNPFSEITTFVIQSEKENEKYSFELSDILGKKVRSMNEISSKQFTISRNGLENGIYFYKIYSSESVVGIGKLVIE